MQNDLSGVSKSAAPSTERTEIAGEDKAVFDEQTKGDGFASAESQTDDKEVISHIPSGIHIMPDGSIMAGDGSMLSSAVVLQDGTIQLENGQIVEPTADLRDATPVSPDVFKHHIFSIEGSDFEYDIKQIKVKKGDTVTINFKSIDGFHDWVLDEFDAASKRVNEGGSTSVTFIADESGTFQYYCSVMNHRAQGMVGYLVVE